MFVAPTLDKFKQGFSDHLAGMLMPDALGAYILVLANSLQSSDLRARLKPGLQTNFAELKSAHEKGSLIAPPDDVAVFEKLLAINPEKLLVTQRFAAGDWQVLLNALRSFRPARSAKQRVTELWQPFKADSFHFNKPFLQAEIFWQGNFENHDLRVLYNKFPLAAFHLLVVPDPTHELPQFLSREYHQLAAGLVKQTQPVLPGLYLGYNSMSAYASVNHLHFHAVIREQELPVENQHWSHRGGVRDYPLSLRLFASAEKSWDYIEHLHSAGQAYNVLYTEYGVYVLVRKAQNTVEVTDSMQSAGWPELSGEIALGAMPDDINIISAEITQGLSQLRVNLDSLN